MILVAAPTVNNEVVQFKLGLFMGFLFFSRITIYECQFGFVSLVSERAQEMVTYFLACLV